MPAKRMNLRMIKDVLRLKLEAHLSNERTARALGISKGAVAKYLALANIAGLNDWSAVRDLDEHALKARLFPSVPKDADVVVPDFGRIHQELGRKGLTLALLWEEYVAAHPGQRTWQMTQFYTRYREYARTLKRSMRQVHLAGEKLFVDYAGPTVPLAGGGRANETVMDFARHYGTSVLPARPGKPRDKPKVESAVQVVERWILARLRHTRFETVFEVDDAIADLLPALNNRAFQKLPGSRYEFARYKPVKVHIDYHVEVEGCWRWRRSAAI